MRCRGRRPRRPDISRQLNYWKISQQCTPKINWHQSYYNHGIATSERAVEGASPYNSEITASPEHGRTLFAPTDVCGIIKGCEINNNAKCQGGWAVEGASPYRLLGEVCCAAKSLRSVQGTQLWSAMLIPHSSFLIPHSSLLTLLALPLDETTVK